MLNTREKPGKKLIILYSVLYPVNNALSHTLSDETKWNIEELLFQWASLFCALNEAAILSKEKKWSRI